MFLGFLTGLLLGLVVGAVFGAHHAAKVMQMEGAVLEQAEHVGKDK